MKIRNPFKEGGSVHRFWQRTSGFRRHKALDKRLCQLASGSIDKNTPNKAIDVFRLWGAPLDQMGESYLRSCIVEYRESQGSILVSGAGVMTLVIGAINHSEDDREVWCFEPNDQWQQMTETWRQQYELTNTFLFGGRSVNCKKGTRYRIDNNALPSDFGMILCEGGSGSMSNPVSTLKLFGNHLAPSFTMLARGVNVDREGPVLMRWAADHGASFVVINKKEGFVKICRNAEKKKLARGEATFEAADIVTRPKAALSSEERRKVMEVPAVPAVKLQSAG